MDMRPFGEKEARAICDWRYDGPYREYDFPAWETVCANGWGFSKPALWKTQFHAVYEDGEYIGFFRFHPLDDGSIELGLGLRPDRCGQGRGGALMELVRQTFARQYPGGRLTLMVRSWNVRAKRCYEKAGFAETGRVLLETPAGPQESIVMGWKAAERPCVPEKAR